MQQKGLLVLIILSCATGTRFLLPFYANVNKVESPFEIQKFVREVRSGDYDSFFRRLQSFFADTTYER